MPACVVTGVSSGIGEAVAKEMIRHGWRVFGTIRSEADAERLEAMLGGQFTALPADVTDMVSLQEAAEDAAESLKGEPLMGLVCNAGISLPGPLVFQPLEELDRMWMVNVRGLIATVQAFAPLLGTTSAHKGKRGRIITVSSVSGEVTYPFVGGYSASKHAVEALSDALRSELIPYGVDVITVSPGPVATPFWQKSAQSVERSRYDATLYTPVLRRLEAHASERARTALPAHDVAAVIHRALTTPKPRARYVVTANKMADWTVPRRMPKRWLDRMIARRLGLKGPQE